MQEGQGEDVYRGMVAGCREHQLLANTPHIDKIADENDADKWKTSDEAIHDARNVGENMLTSLDYLKVWGAIDGRYTRIRPTTAGVEIFSVNNCMLK